MQLKEDKEYSNWYSNLSDKYKAIISKRLYNIQQYGHLGDARALGDKLYELRWKNGLRIYFIRVQDTMILLEGGLKNEQNKSIKKARLIMERYTAS